MNLLFYGETLLHVKHTVLFVVTWHPTTARLADCRALWIGQSV